MIKFIAKAICALGGVLLCAGLWSEISEDPAIAPLLLQATHIQSQATATSAPSLTEAVIRPSATPADPAPTPAETPLERGSVIGQVIIPSIGVTVDLIEGSDDADLLLGAGRVPESDLPGGKHCVISGHRVTRRMHPFRYLDRLAEGDEIIVKTDKAEFRYAVVDAFAVYADETWVLSPFNEEALSLTLITCHPPGSARKRWIVRALLIEDADAL